MVATGRVGLGLLDESRYGTDSLKRVLKAETHIQPIVVPFITNGPHENRRVVLDSIGTHHGVSDR